MDPVLLDVDDGVARVRLNRPDASNAMNLELLRALRESLLRCNSDSRVRAVLLTGEGPNFCGGGDVREFAAQGDRLPFYMREATALLQSAASMLVNLESPVVTAVHGHVAGGGGMGLVCASDLVVASTSAKLLLGAARVGMVPDAGATVALGRIVGHRRALDIALTNRVLTAEDALAAGLVTRVVADDRLAEESLALARSLAVGPTRALAATKHLLWDGLGRGLDDSLPYEARAQSELSGSRDAMEGLRAVIEHRSPAFTGF
jgi:2-(1,2-epoxy-1,2-dihydrophenyl)acetyl-CoA isomerase